MKLIIGFRKREEPIPEFEELHKAADELTKSIAKGMMEVAPYLIRKLRIAGKRGAKAGRKLRKIVKAKMEE